MEAKEGVQTLEPETEKTGELSSAQLPPARHNRPWWVRKGARPGYELDDSLYGTFDPRHTAFALERRQQAASPPKSGRSSALRPSRVFRGRPGWEHPERALGEGANTARNALARQLYSWHHLQARTPDALGTTRYEGTLDSNAHIVKAAAKFYGAVDVGIAALDRRHIYSHQEDGRPITFEDVPEPIVGEDRLVIPDRCRWVVAMAIPESLEAISRAPDAISAATVGMAYSLMAFTAGSLAECIRSLGYTAIPCGNDTGSSVPIAIDAGLGELCRMNLMVNPLWGPRVRLCKVITDLPLAIDSPIEFGVQKFCRTCKKCAEHCPSRSLSTADEPNFEITGEWNNPGHRGWYINAKTCLEYWGKVETGCSTCVRVCPYTKREGLLHSFVRTSISLTPLFNRLFAVGDDWLKYGRRKRPEDWWTSAWEPFGLER